MQCPKTRERSQLGISNDICNIWDIKAMDVQFLCLLILNLYINLASQYNMLEKTKSPNCDSLTADADTKLKQFHIFKKKRQKGETTEPL